MLSVKSAQRHKLALYAECRYAECRNAECRYAECRYAEFRSAILTIAGTRQCPMTFDKTASALLAKSVTLFKVKLKQV
jgi:hypothetical protein